MSNITSTHGASASQKAIEVLEKIIEGCREVRGEDGAHEDAKSIASLVIRACNKAIHILLGRRFPGDDDC